MNKRYMVIIFIFFICLCSFLFILFYKEAKQESIKNLNVRQLLHARQAARSIEDFFENWTTFLTILSGTSHIKDMDNTGRENLERLYKENSELIRIITRVDAGGRIIYTIPYDRNVIGRDISSQKHISEIMKTRKPVVSDVFFALQGYSIIALHVPVFNGNTYHGTVAIGINFQSLAKRYLESIKIGETGYAWIISRDGTELFCPVPGHIGNSVFENCKNFPSILTMAEDMLKGHEGTAIYSFDKIRGDTVETVRKHAVYMPISIGNTFWSIVVASSEDEIISSLKNFRNRLVVIIGVLLLGGILFSFYGLKAWFIIREEEKRKLAEEALRESEATIRALINNAPADSILLLDTHGMILEINQTGAERLGKKRQELIGTSAYNALPGDVAGNRLAIMTQMFETGKLVRFEDKRDEIWFDTVAFPILNKDGTIARISVIARDITRLKQAEELSSRMAREWQQTFDAINAVIWILDKDQRIIRSNKAAEIYFHRSIFDIIGEKCWEIVHGTDEPIPECPVSRARESLQREKMDLRIGDNWFEVTVDPILNEAGEFTGAVHIVSDITDRKLAEEWFKKLNLCFLNFTADPIANINLLVAMCGEMFGAAGALYNRLEGDMLCSIGQWNTPPEYKSVDLADGRICNDVIKGDGENFVIIRNLQDTSYAQSDPNVKPSQIQTYVGKAVQFKDVNIGSLCVVFLRDINPSDNQKLLMGIIASAIGIEEERRNAEVALRESELNYRSIFDSANDAIFVHELETGRILDVNTKMTEMFGYTREEARQIDVESLSTGEPPYTQENALEWIRKAAKEGPQIFEWKAKDKSGRVFWDETSLKLAKIGGNDRLLAMVRDITVRKQAEEALRESEEKYRQLSEDMPVYICTFLPDGTITYVNRAIADLAGSASGALTGRCFFNMLAHDDRAVVEHALASLRPEQSVEIHEQVFAAPDGSLRIIQWTNRAFFDESGRAIFFQAVGVDITERERSEKERQTLAERLARAEKMEALGTLAGGVAHDLNNVLGIVVGYAELLLDEVEKSSPVREHVESIYGGGKKAAAMVEDMLTMARRGVQNRQIINLNRVIIEGKNSPEFINLSPQLSSVQVKEDLDPDLLNISGSPVHLSKTLFNLILNAFEAMPKGGLLTISTYNQYLEKPVKGYDEVRTGDYVVLSVSDSGIGIKPADLKRIFEPFYTKKIMGRSGTGLGLSVVWSTVKDHNGYIDVHSEEGKGSTFTLYFPVSRDEITAESASVLIAEYTGKGESLLVVDDVKGQRDLAAEMLRKLNYKVSGASNGEEAVEYLKDNEVDLVLLDMIMDPGMDGLDTYKKILEIRPKQKAIIVSGFSETDRVEKVKALGAGAYVKKPYVLEKLGLAVKKELERTE